ncbi:MAG: non-canonical purine NTP diphosphatase [Bacteroidota bacterium]|nr:non-canonical purine NTP diphosphatase [Bacteroidota bacterium]
MHLIFATHNKNKVFEVTKLVSKDHEILNLSDINYSEDIPETGDTLEENALLKARFIHKIFNKNCFSDDSGLEIESLNNEPGVYSARYAGEEKSDEANMNKVLEKLNGSHSRSAQFRTVIVLIIAGKEYLFEGIIKGKIAVKKKGSNGFGYDPIFIPNGFIKTFAEMSIEEKNLISHRAIAIKKLTAFLNKLPE